MRLPIRALTTGLILLASLACWAGDRPPVWIGDTWKDLETRLGPQARGEGDARTWTWAHPTFDPDGVVVSVSYPIYFSRAKTDFPRYEGQVLGLQIGDPAARVRQLAGKASITNTSLLTTSHALRFTHQDLAVEVEVWTKDYFQGGERFAKETIRAIRVSRPTPAPGKDCEVASGSLASLDILIKDRNCRPDVIAFGQPKLPASIQARLVLPKGRIVPDAHYSVYAVFENNGSEPQDLVFAIPANWLGVGTLGFHTSILQGERVLRQRSRGMDMFSQTEPDQHVIVRMAPGSRLFATVGVRAWGRPDPKTGEVPDVLSALRLEPLKPGEYTLVMHLPLYGKGPTDQNVRADFSVVKGR